MATVHCAVGQKVAACVPYSKNKRKFDWILAVVVKFIQGKDSYLVNDLFPENRKQSTWTVPSNKVVAFPDTNPSFVAGDKVLSLWYLPDVGEWSSMFYEATVTETPKKRNADLKIRFRGDDQVSTVKSEKVVKMPIVKKKLSVPFPLSMSGSKGVPQASKRKLEDHVKDEERSASPSASDEDKDTYVLSPRTSIASVPSSPTEKHERGYVFTSVLDKKRMKMQQLADRRVTEQVH